MTPNDQSPEPYDACPRCNDATTIRFVREEWTYIDLQGDTTWTDDSINPVLECTDCGNLSEMDPARLAATLTRAGL